MRFHVRFTRHPLVAFAFAVVLNGCASSGNVNWSSAGLPDVQSVHGCTQREFLGLHRVECISWLLGKEDGLQSNDTSTVGVFQHAKWTLQIDAPKAFAAHVKDWYSSHHEPLESRFAIMVDFLDAAYPDNGGRRFRLVLLPDGASYSGQWTESSLDGDGLAMTFAFHLPQSTDVHAESSVADILTTIGHEFSHSYFFFHRAAYQNNYSDEVIAYTTERCVRHFLFDAPLDEQPTAPDDLATASLTQDAGALYDRFAGRYADTIIAFFASGEEVKRVLGDSVRDERAARRYCTRSPLAGRDYTLPRSPHRG
jgi:hypothetical protein